MNYLPQSLILLATALVANDTAFAQSGTSTRRGAFSALSNVHSLSSSPSTDQPRIKDVGDQSASPEVPQGLPASSARMDYSLAAIFGAYPNLDLTLIDIDAMSTGNDRLPITPDGSLIPGIEGWGALLFSVTGNAIGLPGSWVAARSLDAGGPGVGADIMGYYVEDSVGIPSILPDTVFLEQAAEHAGHSPSQEIDAFDVAASYLVMNSAVPSSLFFPINNEFFFSITKDSATSLIGSEWEADILAADMNGATVFQSTRNTDGTWSKPIVFRKAGDLAMTSLDDLDALACGFSNEASGNRFVLFSTAIPDPIPSSPRPQLQVAVGTGPVVTLTARNGTDPITQRARLEDTDDVDAISGLDPDSNATSPWIGIPRTLIEDTGMGFSLSRTTTGPNPPNNILLQVTGWGGRTPSAGVVEFIGRVQGQQNFTSITVSRAANQHSVELAVPVNALPPLNGGVTFEFGAVFIPNQAPMGSGEAPVSTAWIGVLDL